MTAWLSGWIHPIHITQQCKGFLITTGGGWGMPPYPGCKLHQAWQVTVTVACPEWLSLSLSIHPVFHLPAMGSQCFWRLGTARFCCCAPWPGCSGHSANIDIALYYKGLDQLAQVVIVHEQCRPTTLSLCAGRPSMPHWLVTLYDLPVVVTLHPHAQYKYHSIVREGSVWSCEPHLVKVEEAVSLSDSTLTLETRSHCSVGRGLCLWLCHSVRVL